MKCSSKDELIGGCSSVGEARLSSTPLTLAQISGGCSAQVLLIPLMSSQQGES